MPTAEPIRRLDCFDWFNLGTCFIPEAKNDVNFEGNAQESGSFTGFY